MSRQAGNRLAAGTFPEAGFQSGGVDAVVEMLADGFVALCDVDHKELGIRYRLRLARDQDSGGTLVGELAQRPGVIADDRVRRSRQRFQHRAQKALVMGDPAVPPHAVGERQQPCPELGIRDRATQNHSRPTQYLIVLNPKLPGFQGDLLVVLHTFENCADWRQIRAGAGVGVVDGLHGDATFPGHQVLQRPERLR